MTFESTPWVCDIRGCGKWATRVHLGWMCGEHARRWAEYLRKNPPVLPGERPST